MFNYSKIFSILAFLLILNSCQNGKFFKRSDVKDNPVNVEERVERNLEEGKGIRFGKGRNKGGTFDFASSNELWRATVATLDFVPLTNASYSGGIIITDWFNGSVEENINRSLKITVKFLSNEIRSDAIKVDVHERICDNRNNCNTQLIKSKVSGEIKLAILKKAAFMEKNKVAETVKKNKKKRFKKDD
ncbi:DUF3576 domain-containing protein [Candidatus Pelagibacter sp.]|jgi:hypothetical protein|nr:DUF3576 domain-containing protein [Candidatus Pelagibacter sp.]